MSFKRR